MQRQILNIEVRIITVVFIAGAAFAAVCGFSLLGPGRFLDRLWSVKAGSEHQFRTMGWSGPLFLLALAIALIAAGIGGLHPGPAPVHRLVPPPPAAAVLGPPRGHRNVRP
ncbi:MAG: hypothetical protein WBQ71_19490 [Trebonia sp.]